METHTESLLLVATLAVESIVPETITPLLTHRAAEPINDIFTTTADLNLEVVEETKQFSCMLDRATLHLIIPAKQNLLIITIRPQC
jgi:hypothetical protein